MDANAQGGPPGGGLARPPQKPGSGPPGGSTADAGSFGKILLDLGLLTTAQLQRALEVQRERSRRGDFARLGHILVEQGFLTPAQVQQVLQAQAIRILACEACEAQYNIRGWSPGAHYECPKCHEKLIPAEQLQTVAVQDQLEQPGAKKPPPVDISTNTAKIRQLRQLGKYEILGEIARGGMGIIYKARQVDLDRIVALKTLRKEELTKPDAAARFRGEAQSVAGLRHPNIVAVHEVGSHDGIEYFTMEFVEGLPLDRILLRERVTPRRAVEIVVPIAEALEYAHRASVVHRDLKPGNIIIDREGTPFLVDFGIAKRITKRLERDDEEDLLGSIPYMAPEYVEGAAYDELCDLYSLGVVLYEAVCGPGTLPVYDDDTRRFLEKIVRCEHKPIRERLPDLDPELSAIIDKMIAPRAQRYQDMKSAATDLRRWLLRLSGPPGGAPFDGAAPGASDSEAPTPKAGVSQSRGAQAGQRGLVAALAVAGLGVLGLGGALLQARDSQAEALILRERQHQDELAYNLLSSARDLADAGRPERALETLSHAVARLAPDGTATGSRPILADIYALRGKLRTDARQPGAEADTARAAALR